MARKEQFVTDEQLKKFKPLLPQCQPSSKGGRKPRDNREVLKDIAWVLCSGRHKIRRLWNKFMFQLSEQ